MELSRRDVLNGAVAAVGAAVMSSTVSEAQGQKSAGARTRPANEPFGYCLNTSTIRGNKLDLPGVIGAASKAGILFKGSNFLDVLREIDTVVLDKTGTLTKGVFEVQQVQPAPGTEPAQLLRLVPVTEDRLCPAERGADVRCHGVAEPHGIGVERVGRRGVEVESADQVVLHRDGQ